MNIFYKVVYLSLFATLLFCAFLIINDDKKGAIDGLTIGRFENSAKAINAQNELLWQLINMEVGSIGRSSVVDSIDIIFKKMAALERQLDKKESDSSVVFEHYNALQKAFSGLINIKHIEGFRFDSRDSASFMNIIPKEMLYEYLSNKKQYKAKLDARFKIFEYELAYYLYFYITRGCKYRYKYLNIFHYKPFYRKGEDAFALLFLDAAHQTYRIKQAFVNGQEGKFDDFWPEATVIPTQRGENILDVQFRYKKLNYPSYKTNSDSSYYIEQKFSYYVQ